MINGINDFETIHNYIGEDNMVRKGAISAYKDEIVLIDDQRIIIGMGLLVNGYNMNSINDNELESAKEWLLKLKNNLKAYDSDSPKNFLITEEASIAVLWNAEAALAKEYNPNIEIVFPKEGIALSIDNFAIPKGSKHKEDTYLFIDYILRPYVMKEIIESYPYKNINIETDKLLSNNYLLNDAANISDENMKKGFSIKLISVLLSLAILIACIPMAVSANTADSASARHSIHFTASFMTIHSFVSVSSLDTFILPKITNDLSKEVEPSWLAVPEFYGGFSYCLGCLCNFSISQRDSKAVSSSQNDKISSQ